MNKKSSNNKYDLSDIIIGFNFDQSKIHLVADLNKYFVFTPLGDLFTT